MIEIILSCIALFLGLVSFVIALHCSVVFHRFNVGIKDWSNALDASTKDAIERSARRILRELDEKISEVRENSYVESLNNHENEKDC